MNILKFWNFNRFGIYIILCINTCRDERVDSYARSVANTRAPTLPFSVRRRRRVAVSFRLPSRTSDNMWLTSSLSVTPGYQFFVLCPLPFPSLSLDPFVSAVSAIGEERGRMFELDGFRLLSWKFRFRSHFSLSIFLRYRSTASTCRPRAVKRQLAHEGTMTTTTTTKEKCTPHDEITTGPGRASSPLTSAIKYPRPVGCRTEIYAVSLRRSCRSLRFSSTWRSSLARN